MSYYYLEPTSISSTVLVLGILLVKWVLQEFWSVPEFLVPDVYEWRKTETDEEG